MTLKCGIVGLPNVGKSTLFNALTSGAAAAENYPFCTIDPNVGLAELQDARLVRLAETVRAAKVVPAAVEFCDIAGLVRGASENAGLGNRFLSHIRETDGVAHVVRCFADKDVSHVEERLDPAHDIAVVNAELALADLATAEKVRARAAKTARIGDAGAKALAAVCEKIIAHLDAGKPARTLDLSDDEKASAREMFLLTMKPAMYVANVDEGWTPDGDGGENEMLRSARDAVRAEEGGTVGTAGTAGTVGEDGRGGGGGRVIPICARLEAEIASLPLSERGDFLREMGLAESGLSRLARAAFEMLGLMTFFTAGPKEARAWVVRRGATAREAAGAIHTDFARGFICAEVCDWGTFADLGGESSAREAGKLRQEGRDHIVQDGDVIHFRFNV